MYCKRQRLVFSQRGVLHADRMNDTHMQTNYCMPRGSAYQGITTLLPVIVTITYYYYPMSVLLVHFQITRMCHLYTSHKVPWTS